MSKQLLLLFLPAFVQAQVILPAVPPSMTEPLRQAGSLTRQGKYREAIQAFEAMLPDTTAAKDVDLRAYLLSEITHAEMELGDYRRAEQRSREALGDLASYGQTHTARFLLVEGALADALLARRQYREAKAHIDHALSLCKEIFIPEHPRVGHLLITLAGVLRETGDLRRAEETCRHAVAAFENAGEANRIHLGTAWQNLAMVEALRKRPKQGLEAICFALAAWNDILPPDHPYVIGALGMEIAIYGNLKQFRSAETIIPDALRQCLSRFGQNHPERVSLLNIAAAVYIADRKYEEAEALLREALSAGRLCFPAGHPVLTHTLRSYSRVLASLNRVEEASRMRAESEVVTVTALAGAGH